MAVLNKIRQRSVFLILIIALALFSFVLADVFQSGGFSPGSQSTIAKINGTDISREDFTMKVNAMQQNLGSNASTSQAVNMVWNNELRRVLFEEQYSKLGIEAGSAQINAALAQAFAYNPAFQNEAGAFDYGKMQQYIATLRTVDPEQYREWLQYENTIAQGVKEQTYLNMIRAGLGATFVEGELEYQMENSNVSIQYVQIPYTSVSDDAVPVSESEIAAYIKKNPEQFKTEASVDIQYVLFVEEPSEADEEQVKNEITALLSEKVEYNSATGKNDTIAGFRETRDNEEFVAANSEVSYNNRWWFKDQLPADNADNIFNLKTGEVFGPYKVGNSYNLTKVVEERHLPDSTNVSHILVSWEGLQTAGGITRTKEEAEKLADSILTVIKRDGSKFADLAVEFSNDPSAAQNNGELGYLAPGDTVEEFDEFMLNSKSGDKGVVETSFGYHVVSIGEIKNVQRAVRVANIYKSIEPSEATIGKLFADATRFESQVSENDFISVAASHEMEVRPVNKIGELQENIPGIGNNRELVKWAFEKGAKPGNVKRFSVNNGYAIVQLTAKQNKGLMSVAEASGTVTPIIRNEKKAKQIRESIKGKTLEEIAQEKSVQVKTASALNMKNPTIADAGTEPKVVGAAFGLKAGETSDFIDGVRGVYKITVTAINEAPARDSYENFANQIMSRRTNTANNSVFNALRNKADIDDRRAAFY